MRERNHHHYSFQEETEEMPAEMGYVEIEEQGDSSERTEDMNSFQEACRCVES